MKFTQHCAALVLLCVAVVSPVAASPHSSLRSVLETRQKANILLTFLQAIKLFTDDSKNGWEQRDMCSLTMSTKDGIDCKTRVECGDDKRDYSDQWSVCYVGGRQFFTDDRIGDFSIKNAEKNTDEYEGLTHPILQVKYVADWVEYDVNQLAKEANDRSDESDPFKMPNKENICAHYSDSDDTGEIKYICAVPMIGKGPEGMDSDGPVNEAGYRPGWCGIHVTQHQKPDPAKDSYKFDIAISDVNEDIIGEVKSVEANEGYTLTSKLPLGLVVTAGDIDSDPVYFAYGGEIWGSADAEHHCNFGSYDNGKRDGDCGFTC